jgi:hypothetical protein
MNRTKRVSRRPDTAKQSSVDHSAIPDMDASQTFNWNETGFSHANAMASALPESVPLDIPENFDWATWDSLFVDLHTSGVQDDMPDLNMFDVGMQ